MFCNGGNCALFGNQGRIRALVLYFNQLLSALMANLIEVKPGGVVFKG